MGTGGSSISKMKIWFKALYWTIAICLISISSYAAYNIGYLFSAGISFGYVTRSNTYWGIAFSIGFGFATFGLLVLIFIVLRGLLKLFVKRKK
jgi:hypothetical protein